MQFSPDTPFFLTVLFHFPLPLTKDLEPRGVDNEVHYFTLRWRFKRDIHGLFPFADECVTRTVQWHFHQGENGVDEALEGPKYQTENTFQHQYGGNGHIGIMLWATTNRRCYLAAPGVKFCFINTKVRIPR